MEKQRKLKVIILSTLIVGILTLTIAFSAISRTLNIGGVGKMDTAKWDIRFENLRAAEITRDALEVSKPSIVDDGGVVSGINIRLTKPKDEISYKVDIANNGTIDAEVNVMAIADLTEKEKKLIDFGVYYLNGSKITKYDLLEPGDKKTIIIKIRYKDDITEFDLPSEPLEIKLSCQIQYIQSDADFVIIPNGDFDINENGDLILTGVESVLAEGNDSYSSMFFNGTITKNKVESISFLNTLKVPGDAKDTAWDASLKKDGSVVAWYTDLDKNNLYELYIGGNGKIYAPENSSNLFKNFTALKEINFNNIFDTITATTLAGMFSNCSILKKLDVSSFNTSNVTNMESMFGACSSLTSLDLGSFDTINVITMKRMFSGCRKVEMLNLNNFNTTNVTNMSYMFETCFALTKLLINNFNTANVTDMSYMFAGHHNFNSMLKNLDLSSFDTANVTDMNHMFYCSNSLENLNISSFDTSNVTNMSYMFGGYDYYGSVKEMSFATLDLSGFNTKNVMNMSGLFYKCSLLKSLINFNFDTTNVTNMSNMFFDCENLVNLDISNFNTSKVTDMSEMFSSCLSLMSLDLSSFDTTSVTNMSGMFRNCISLTTLNLNNFNTTNVTNMSSMFACTHANYDTMGLTSLNLSSFDTSNVTIMSSMFYNCTKITSLNLITFDTTNVTTMRSMFENCKMLERLDLSSFDTTNVTNMTFMFRGCILLTTLNLSKAKFNKVTKYTNMLVSVPSGIKIYVLDEDAKTFILVRKSDANVIISAPVAYKNDSLDCHFLLL